jgi:hypothetical protein
MSVGSLTFENNAFWRYRTLLDRIAKHRGLFTSEDLKANNACVNIRTLIETLRADPAQRSIAASVPSRTLWHSLYDQKARTVEFSFYLGEDVHADGTLAEHRSDYLKFALEDGDSSIY